MRSVENAFVLWSVVAVMLLGCSFGVAPAAVVGETGLDTGESPILLGPMTRGEVEEAMPEWVASTIEAEPDPEAAVALADLATTAQVTVFFGSWCSDSRRELSRLWKALDLTGADPGFSIRYVGVDRSKKEPAESVGGREILYVPTFVVEKDGQEVGQIIEQSPHGIESDLLALLTGDVSGWISERDDLPSPPSNPR